MRAWSSEIIFSSLVPLSVLFVLIVLEYSAKIRQRQALRIIAQQFGGSCSKFFLSAAFKGEFQGLPVAITYEPQRKNSPAYLRIYLKKETRLKFKIYRESIISKWGEKTGLVHEVKTGDESFDNDFLIYSNIFDQAAAYLAGQDKKNTVREFFNRGFDALIMDGKKIMAQKPYSYKNDSTEDISIQKVKEVLGLLVKLTFGI